MNISDYITDHNLNPVTVSKLSESSLKILVDEYLQDPVKQDYSPRHLYIYKTSCRGMKYPITWDEKRKVYLCPHKNGRRQSQREVTPRQLRLWLRATIRQMKYRYRHIRNEEERKENEYWEVAFQRYMGCTIFDKELGNNWSHEHIAGVMTKFTYCY